MADLENSKDLISVLWSGADILRSKMDANEYKDYLLGIVFYKYLSDSFLIKVYDLIYDEKPETLKIALDAYKESLDLIKPDVCDLFLLGKPCSHKLSFLRPRLERGAFLREFSRLLTWGKWGFSNRNRPGEPFFVRAVPIA